jgi:UDP-N-acetyl-D-mannosaminuronic acid dehydrogenase
VRGYLRDGQLLILRSTVFPGVTALVEKMVAGLGVEIEVAFCPERIAEGKAMTELFELPQIVSARSPAGTGAGVALFGRLTSKLVVMSPEEAELAKLFTNVWRYIKFATANQLYMMANDRGLDFERIRQGLTEDYPRAADMPAAGFAAGPCLFKDTMQLAAFNHNNFALGHGDGDQRGPAAVRGAPAGAAVRPGLDDGRDPGDGVQGRARTTSGPACRTSSSGSWSSRPARCCAPTRT